VSVSDERLGHVLLADGKPDEALTRYRSSLERMRSVLARDPSNVEVLRFTSGTLVMVGDALLAESKPGEAAGAYRESLGIRQRLAGDDPSNAAW
jgi:predicted negative regulator of RcsB-dependent stress response